MYNDFINLCKSFIIFAKQVWKLLCKLLIALINFLSPYEKSIYKAVSPEEFYRIMLLALSAGGGFSGFITYLKGHVQEFVTDPNIAMGVQAFIQHCIDKKTSVAIFICIFVLEYVRRKYHGENQK